MEIIKEQNTTKLWNDAHQEFLAKQLLKVPESFTHFSEADVFQTIHARFEQIVERHPQNIAIKTPDWALTYQGLNQRANQIAHAIISQFGSDPQQVAFLLPNDGSAIAVILGILKAGRSYVPLDPLFPQDRLVYMLADSQSAVILTDNANIALANELNPGGTIINLDSMDDSLSIENPAIYVEPLSLAYILYTSGSTGLPKGIGFGHRNLLHTTMCLVNSLRISPEDSMTQLHSTSFAASIVDIYCSLTAGATLYPWDVKTRGFSGLANWLRDERVTSFQWIPTPFRHFMDTLESDEQLPDIRLVVMASEPLTSKEMILHRRHFAKDSLLVNQMGTSESFNYNLFFICQDTLIDSYIMPAGYSVSEDRDVLILDENHQPVEAGVVGEIAIQTEYMSFGYWQKPDLTAEKFLPDPNGGDKTIYLTGDLGKIPPDGCLIHLGRKDFQVKIRGYRIEINEIEKALNDIPGLSDAVVVAKESAQGDNQLIAYIVLDKTRPGSLILEEMSVHQNGQKAEPTTNRNSIQPFSEPQYELISVDSIKFHLQKRLPEYMIPSLFVKLDAFPTTPTGKMDRMGLPEPPLVDESVDKRAHILPSTPTEHQLAKMWSKLLGLPSISTQDSFFELGGHSLVAARMFFEIERDLEVRLPLSTLFYAHSISELAKVIDGESEIVSWSSLTPIQPNGSKPPLYIIHAHGGNVLGYFELSQYLDSDQPFYGLQAMGLDGKSIETRSMDEIAAAYLAEIRSLQPRGPYYLAGYCFGGNMAYAMAQQLLNIGEEVAFLALIESSHIDYPTYPDDRSTWTKVWSKAVSRLSYEWDAATSQGVGTVWPHTKARFLRTMDILQIKIERKLDAIGTRFGLSTPQSKAYIQDRLEQVHDKAYYGYKVTPYPGDILLFRAKHQPTGIIPDETLGWGNYVQGELKIHEIPGYPVGILDEPRVQEVAKVMNKHLRAVHAQSGNV